MNKRLFVLLVLLVTPLLVRGSDSNNCESCHSDQAEMEKHSIHFQEGIHCADCHGGNPKGTEMETAHDSSFKGVPSRLSIPQFCGNCHSDVRRMNPFGIPTDQYAQYLTSHHGEKLAAGNTDVATCIDCHGNHGIIDVRNPQSPVFPKNVPATCGKCHSNEKLMQRHGLPWDQQKQYMQSIHAELLFQRDDLSAPTCSTCHGNHGAVPPGFTEISSVCGKCHVKQQEFYLQSPHAAFAQEIGFQSCVTCHTNHKVLRTAQEILQRCTDCHSEQDEAMKIKDNIFSVIANANHRYQKTEEILKTMARAGYNTEDEELLLQEAKTAVLQLPPVQHKLQFSEVQKVAANANQILDRIELDVQHKQKVERMKKLALLPVWLFLTGMAIVFWKKHKELQYKRKLEP